MKRIFAGLIAFTLTNCSAGTDLAASDTAVSTFHAQLDAQEFDAIFQSTTPQFKTSGPKGGFVGLLSAISRKLGKLTTSKRMGFNIGVVPAGRFVTVRYSSVFERGVGNETFTFQMVGEKAVLNGYNMASPALTVRYE